MAGGVMLTSAAGVLSLLDEPDDTLKVYALQQLDKLVDHFWVEIASAIPKIETLYENEAFRSRNLAAVVASKVFYHLEELDDALRYALGAGDLFDVSQKSEYVETLIAKCIDNYIAVRTGEDEQKAKEESKLDPRLEAIVNRMFDRCFEDGEFKQALGVALEARRLDILAKSIEQSDDVPGMLAYCFDLSQTVVLNREFRQQVLRVLVDLYQGLQQPDYVNMCHCLLFLGDHQKVASILDGLIKNSDARQSLLAYQVAFDLSENQNSAFLVEVSKTLPVVEKPAPSSDAVAAPASGAATPDDSYYGRMQRLKSILSGELPTDLYLHFLYSHNKADLNILKIIKDKLETRNSVTHNALVMAHAFMHAGTTVDVFLRDNLEWLSRATNWAKFTATASIGVIHKGHFKESLRLLEPYLPQHGQGGSPYQEGGALYALGLIHANLGGEKTQYLLDALRNAGTNEIVQHGACLGIGLSAMAAAKDTTTTLGTSSEPIYDTLNSVLLTDSAIAGEAAGIALGLVFLGSGCGQAIEDMLNYAHETKHEKIIRGLAMGLALIQYGREEAADVLIEQLLRDKDPILRYGGMYAIALAYVGTANNTAIRRLLHVAVSDVSNDVRRAAVTALGFVLCNSPEQVPRIVSLLAESYNPHVRYGACFAVGIACAGSGLKDAIELLEPLAKDRVDFVRQGAFIALAMVIMQLNNAKEPRVDAIRKSFADAIAAKGDTMTKFGAILASGIVDAGGRNVAISLLSPAGHKKTAAIVGMALFPQFWYWYPLVHFISLSFAPTAVVGLNKNLQMPKDFAFVSNAPPSHFAYPPPVEIKKEEKKKKVPTATLSVTAKAKAKAKKKNEEAEAGGSSATPAPMDVDATAGAEKKDGEKKDEEKKEEKKEEAKSETLSNPSRVTRHQQPLLTFDAAQRYKPVKKHIAGFVLLEDSTPDQPEQLVVQSAPKIAVPGVSDDEPAPPQPFEFRG